MSSEITRAQRTCGCCWGVCYRTGSAHLQLSAKNSLAALISLAETKGVSHSHVNRSLGLAFLIAVGFNKEKCKGGLKNESSAPSPAAVSVPLRFLLCVAASLAEIMSLLPSQPAPVALQK